MGQLIIPMQDIINAICIYHSRRKYVEPEEVEVELFYEDYEGFSAEVFVNGQQQVLATSDMIAALRLWLEEVLDMDPYAAGIELQFVDDETGIVAEVN